MDKIPYNVQPRNFPSMVKAASHPFNIPIILRRENPVDNYDHPIPLREIEKIFYPRLAAEFGELHLNEHVAPIFYRWKNTTETSQTIEVVPSAEWKGYTEHIGQIPVNVQGITKWITPSSYDGPINKVGKSVSMNQTTRDHYMKFLGSQEIQSLSHFMESSGYKPTWVPEKIATGYIPSDAIAAIARGSNITKATNKTAFVFNKDTLHKVANEAAYHGVRPDLELLNTMMHEMVHVYGIQSERELEELLTEFYSRMADKEFKGYTDSIPVSSRSEYKKWDSLRKIAASRARMWGPSLGQEKGISHLVKQWYAEAEEMGLEGKDIEAFVEYCKQVFKETDYETTEKSGTDNYESKAGKNVEKETSDKEASEETLEQMVEEAA